MSESSTRTSLPSAKIASRPAASAIRSTSILDPAPAISSLLAYSPSISPPSHPLSHAPPQTSLGPISPDPPLHYVHDDDLHTLHAHPSSQSHQPKPSSSLSRTNSLTNGNHHNHNTNTSIGNSNSNSTGNAAMSLDDAIASSTTLKRKFLDTSVDYPRRRATIACQVCRARKSRCDGNKPKCKLCTELGAECVYREPGIKLDAGDKLILEQLNRMENFLRMNLQPAHAVTHPQNTGLSTALDTPASTPSRPHPRLPGPSGSQAMSISSLTQPTDPEASPSHTPYHSHTHSHSHPHSRSLSQSLSQPISQSQSQSQPPSQPHLQPQSQTQSQPQSQPQPQSPPSHPSPPHFVHGIPNIGFGSWPHAPPMMHPHHLSPAHTNTALHILQWPILQDLVSRRYDPQIMVQLEMAREPLHGLAKIPSVDLSNTQVFIEAFFERVHVWYACISPSAWPALYRAALSNGFREGSESCIALLVMALGEASLHGSISRLVPHDAPPPGSAYFTAAWSLLPTLMTNNSILAAQCHLLAAAYLFYLVRPLDAWSLLCTASTKLQLLLLTASPSEPSQERELLERVYWNVLLFESDLHSEFQLPESGLVHYDEQVGLPGRSEPPDSDASSPDNLWYFLAEIALRRLFNRVSQFLYTTAVPLSLPVLKPLVADLDFQLTQWYESLPAPLQFPFSREPLHDPVMTVLRLRFFACRTVIYRPYVLAVLTSESEATAVATATTPPAGTTTTTSSATPNAFNTATATATASTTPSPTSTSDILQDPVVKANCQKCLDAAVRQIENITAHHAGHMPYLWQGALSIVSQTLLVMAATMSPPLRSILLTLVPSLTAVNQMLHDTLAELDRYTRLAPSLRLAVGLVHEAEQRRRAFLGVEV